MRWFVDISSLGKDAPPGTTLCVEASAWQPALQKARSLRGDEGALSNFSIELLDEGYRAIDPATRVRYVVRKAPDDAALTNGSAAVRTSTAPASAKPASSKPASTKAASSRPASGNPASSRPASGKPAANLTLPSATNEASQGRTSRPAPPVGYSEPPGRAQKTKLDGTRSGAPAAGGSEPPKKRTPVQTVAFGSRGAAVVSEPPPPVAPRPASVPPAAAGTGAARPSSAPAFAGEGPERRATGSYVSPGSASMAPMSNVPPSAVISSRHEEPSERAPLTYREFAYAVAEGTSVEAAEALLLSRLDEVRLSLAEMRSGKLVNLAAFDHSYRGRPLRAPIATLSWKDWKGEAEIRFPLRDGPGNTPTVPRTLKEPEPALPLVTRAADTGEAPVPLVAAKEAPLPLVAAKAPSDRPTRPAAAAPPSDDGPTQALASVPAPPSRPDDVAVDSPPAAASAPPPGPPPPAEAAPAEAAAPRASASAPPSSGASAGASQRESSPAIREKRRQTPRPAAGDIGRGSIPPTSKRFVGEELITELFEASADLSFMSNTLEGAEFVMALMREKIPSEVAVVSLFDINRREFVVVRQSGARKSAVLTRVPERARIPQEAMRTKRAVVVSDASSDERAHEMGERWQAMGVDLRSLICAPVEVGGRYLGLLELANPLEGGGFTAGDGHALTFIGQKFAEFVAERGVVTDADHVGQSGHLQ